MAFLFAEGFDKYDTTGTVTTALGYFWNTVTYSSQLSIQTGRDATDYSLRFDGDTLRKTMTPSGRHFITFSIQAVTDSYYSFFVRFGTNNYLQFYYDSMNFYWTMDSYFGGSMVNHGDIGSLTTWKTIEIALDPSGTVANACYIDENSVMSRTASFTHGNYVEFASDSSGGYGYDVDHIGCWDSSGSVTNNRLGKTYRVKNIKPSADSTPDQWTAVGETDAYNTLDNVPLDVTKYIKGLTDNDVTQTSFGNLTGTPPVIAGVQFQAVALNSDATTKDLIFVMDSSGTATEIGSATTPGGSLGGKLSAHGTNPITSSAWTYTEVNALIAGVKRKA